jgi:hypothetical protein
MSSPNPSPKQKKITKTVGLRKVPGGWSVVEAHIQDGRLLREVLSEPDLRSVAQESFMRKVAHMMMEDE